MTKILRYFIVLLILVLPGCDKTAVNDGIPLVYVNETINLNNFEYSALNLIGGYVYLDAGVRGIIVYRKSENAYLAFERNCTFQPLSKCALVSVDKSTLFMIDTCCASTFDFDGYPTGGPADIPLRQYHTSLQQNLLNITSDLP